MLRQIEVGDFANSDACRIFAQYDDRISSLKFSLLKHLRVEACATAVQKSLNDVIALEFCGQLEAGQAGLRYGQYRSTNAEMVADADACFRKPGDGQVFAERSPRQLLP